MFSWFFRKREVAPPPMPPPEPSRALPGPGEILGDRYRLDSLIGRGGSGLVFRGCDLRLDMPVAIKVVPHDPEEGVHGDLRDEARAAMRLSHPSIVRIWHWDVYGPCEALVMELVDGADLQSVARQRPERCLPEAEAVAAVLDVLSALEYAHGMGVVHNDIKPRNMLLASDGRVRLCDFGIAGRHGMGDARPGMVTGTLAFMAPERLRRERGGPLSDLYAVGVSLYVLLDGRPPFDLKPGARDRGPMASSTRIRPALHNVLARAIAMSPADRYTSAADRAAALRSATATDGPKFSAPGAQAWLEASTPAVEAAPAPLDDLVPIPRRKVRDGQRLFDVPPFLIEREPVTHGRYGEFVTATGAPPPEGWHGSSPPFDLLDHPVVGISLEQARAYADWRGRRLPTSVEWLSAAAGASGTVFPWGAPCGHTRCHCPVHKHTGTAAVGTHPRGRSLDGVDDLYGNVWEWTENEPPLAPDDPSLCFAFGASYRHSCSAPLGTVPRTVVSMDRSYAYVGFRCVADARGG